MSEEIWYQEGLRFGCTGCGGCCSGAPGFVWVNKGEIEALAAAIRVDVDEFEKRYIRRVGVRQSLNEFPNGDCVFFHNESRTCQVYAVRPRQCRTWPFWESNLRSPQTWEDVCRSCPGASRGPLVPLERIQSQREVMSI